MKLFKPKARLSDVCQQFYDKQILHPTIPGTNIDLPSVYFEGVSGSIIEVDQAFSRVQPAQFVEEMVAIYFEVFGLAWLHEVGEKYTATQSAYTKNYLERKNRLDIWETMGEYNQAIARSVNYGVDRDTPEGKMFVALGDKEKVDKFKLWMDQGIDAKCVARAANRLGTEKAWADNRTRSALIFTLCTRVGYDPMEFNDDARFRLEATIFGLYKGAKEFLSEFRVTH